MVLLVAPWIEWDETGGIHCSHFSAAGDFCQQTLFSIFSHFSHFLPTNTLLHFTTKTTVYSLLFSLFYFRVSEHGQDVQCCRGFLPKTLFHILKKIFGIFSFLQKSKPACMKQWFCIQFPPQHEYMLFPKHCMCVCTKALEALSASSNLAHTGSAAAVAQVAQVHWTDLSRGGCIFQLSAVPLIWESRASIRKTLRFHPTTQIQPTTDNTNPPTNSTLRSLNHPEPFVTDLHLSAS